MNKSEKDGCINRKKEDTRIRKNRYMNQIKTDTRIR